MSTPSITTATSILCRLDRRVKGWFEREGAQAFHLPWTTKLLAGEVMEAVQAVLTAAYVESTGARALALIACKSDVRAAVASPRAYASTQQAVYDLDDRVRDSVFHHAALVERCWRTAAGLDSWLRLQRAKKFDGAMNTSAEGESN